MTAFAKLLRSKLQTYHGCSKAGPPEIDLINTIVDALQSNKLLKQNPTQVELIFLLMISLCLFSAVLLP